MRNTLFAALVVSIVLLSDEGQAAVVVDSACLQRLPVEGAAWQHLVDWSVERVTSPTLADQDDEDNVRVLARALYAVRTQDEDVAQSVRRALARLQRASLGANGLAMSRNLSSYVIAADLVGLRGEEQAQFKSWLRRVAARRFGERSLRETHEQRPNNWGTHAGASRMAVALYLQDRAEFAAAVKVYRGWLGEPDGWQGFEFGERWWQASRFRSYAVNPRGAVLRGYPVGGVLPDDQRRGGRFRWPPPAENYVYEALQGAVLQALILSQQGYPSWQWGDQALFRAFDWLHQHADYPATGDDVWMVPVINQAYGANFPHEGRHRPGKAFGFSAWLLPALALPMTDNAVRCTTR